MKSNEWYIMDINDPIETFLSATSPNKPRDLWKKSVQTTKPFASLEDAQGFIDRHAFSVIGSLGLPPDLIVVHADDVEYELLLMKVD